MRAEELRIGNFVHVPHGDVQIKRFTEIGAHFIDDCGGTFASLDPIPLTEEWLKRFGWSEVKKFEFFGEFGLIQQGQRYCFARSDAYSVTVFHSIEYVHQLQNLYFALTGEELKLN